MSAPGHLRRLSLLALLALGLALLAGGLCASSWRCSRGARGLLAGHGLERLDGRPERVVITPSPRRVADYYTGSGDLPLVVLVHGSHPAGGRGALTRLLAERLNARGFSVLAPDLRGHGGSAPPLSPLAGPVPFAEDVAAAARWARRGRLPGSHRIVYAGHSLGAGAVLRAARMDPRPAAVAALGAPATRAPSHPGGPSLATVIAPDVLEHMGLEADPASLAVMERQLLAGDVAELVAAADLPPVLLVYGAEEPGLARARPRLEAAPGGFRLRVVSGAGHLYGVTGALGGVVLRDRRPVDELVAVLEEWLARPRFRLTVSSGTGGGFYRQGEAVSVSAAGPPPGRVFDRWRGDTGALRDPSSALTTVTLPAGGARILATYRSGPPDPVPRWRRHVVALGNPTWEGNPFEVEVEATFTHPSGGSWTLPGYYAGGGTWKIAFMPTEVGEWTWRTASADPDLDGRTGALTCVASEHPGLLASDPHHRRKWKYSHGPHVVPLAFRFDLFQEEGSLERLGEIADFLRHQVHGHLLEMTLRNEVYTPDWRSRRFNLPLWDRFEQRLEILAERGLGVHVMLYSDDRQQPRWPAGSAAEELLIRYLVARLAAFPAVLFNTGIDIGEYRDGGWVDRFGERIRALDPYGHPVSSRHGLAAQPHEMAGQTFSSEGDLHARVGVMTRHFQTSRVPVSMDDAWAEASPAAARRGADFRPADIRRAVWKAVVAGGLGVLIRGSRLHNEDLWFRMADFEEDLESEAWIGRVNPLIAERLGETFGAMVPEPALAAGGHCLADPGRSELLCLRLGEDDRWDPAPGGPLVLRRGELPGRYRASWLDPRSGEEIGLGTLEAGAGDLTLRPPGDQDWVLLMTREG